MSLYLRHLHIISFDQKISSTIWNLENLWVPRSLDWMTVTWGFMWTNSMGPGEEGFGGCSTGKSQFAPLPFSSLIFSFLIFLYAFFYCTSFSPPNYVFDMHNHDTDYKLNCGFRCSLALRPWATPKDSALHPPESTRKKGRTKQTGLEPFL